MTNPVPQNHPVLTVTLTPESESYRESPQQSPLDIDALSRQFPAIQIFPGQSEGQLILGGTSASDLNDIWTYIRDEQKIQWDVGELEVTYLETICKPAEAEGKYIRQTGGSGNYGHCRIRLTPNHRGGGYSFFNAVPEGRIPSQFIDPIDFAIRDTLNRGILRGLPIVDVAATLFDGSYHERDSNETAFRLAASIASKEALRSAAPVILEPMAEVLVESPAIYAGSLINDLNRRRARIQSIDNSAGMTEIRAIMPLAETLLKGSFAYTSLTVPGIEDSIRFLGYEPIVRGSEPGDEPAGVIAWKPDGPGPKHRSAAADLLFDQE